MRSWFGTHGEFQPGKTLTGPLMFHRADLVPVYSFGENELFQQVIFPEGSLGRRLQDLFKKIMGFAPCLFIGERMALVPYKIPITIVGKPAVLPHPLNFGNILFCHAERLLLSVGRPIPVPKRATPTEEEVDHYHELYMEALSKLFHEHKLSCGLPEEHKLQIM